MVLPHNANFFDCYLMMIVTTRHVTTNGDTDYFGEITKYSLTFN